MNILTSLLYFQTQPKRIYLQSLKCLTSDKLKTTSFINTEGGLFSTYIHVVEALTKSIASRTSSLFRGLNHGHLDPGFH